MGGCLAAGISRREFLGFAGIAGASLLMGGFATGCSDSGGSTSSASLEGRSLSIYCGAGMKDPFGEIADAFKAQTGCEMNVTYANAAQIQTQITTTNEGDFFIAGSRDEFDKVYDHIASSVDLVKHVPVIIVPAANPYGIAAVADLGKVKSLLIGDPDATPIGKIAKNALTKAGVWDSLNASGVITTTTTAPQISAALARGEGDAGIVWKENATSDGISIVGKDAMEPYIKTVPAGLLKSSADTATAQAFNDFLQTDAAHDIWTRYGYEIA